MVHTATHLGGIGASTVLIEGEPGTGRSLTAQLLHGSNGNASGPLLAVNCAALPESLLHAELFGEASGSVPGALDRQGLIELAQGGMLLLKEVDQLPVSLQSKLLDVLEDGVLQRAGGAENVPVDLRLIASSEMPLAEAVRHHGFHSGLYQRLTVAPIRIPPLRARAADILPLANHFAAEFTTKYHSRVAGLTPVAGDVLLAHSWPGNVRELRSVMERAVLSETEASIHPHSIQFVPIPSRTDLDLAAPHPAPPSGTGLSLKDSERGLIVRALETTGGNQTKAARLLGISRDMLRYRVKKLGLRIADL